jgi:hypothetical protein
VPIEEEEEEDEEEEEEKEENTRNRRHVWIKSFFTPPQGDVCLSDRCL